MLVLSRYKNRICILSIISCFLFLNSALALATSVNVAKVSDGDTVLTEEVKWVRLLGIDTPEMGYIDKDKQYVEDPAPIAQKAKTYLESLVLSQECYLEYDQDKKDHFGRTLAYLFRKKDGLDINRAMLEKGLAVIAFYPPNLELFEEYLEAQKTARTAGIGLWSLNYVSADEALKYKGQLRTVRGRVNSVHLGRRFVYLNFGQNYKTDFTIEIARKNLKYFADLPKMIDEWYTGKQVEVSARIKERNGPVVQIAMPEQIIIISE